MTWLTGRIGAALGAVVAFLALLAGAKIKGRSEGRKEALEDVQEADQKRADSVRKRVDDVERVQNDDIRYRD
jgi:hypothetical protein